MVVVQIIYCGIPAYVTVQSFVFQLGEDPKSDPRASLLEHSSFFKRRFQTTAHLGTAGRRPVQALCFPICLYCGPGNSLHLALACYKAGGASGSRNTSLSAPCFPACRWHSRPSTTESRSRVERALQPLSQSRAQGKLDRGFPRYVLKHAS